MPANERQAFEQLSNMFVDKNGNGIPDFLEGDMAQNVITAITSNVHYNGQTYNSVNELPPDVRGKVQEAFAKLEQLGIAPQASSLAVPTEPISIRSYEPTIQEDTGSGTKWIFLGAGLLIGLALAAVAVFLLIAR